MSIKKVANILGFMDQRKAAKLLAFLEEKDEKLASQIRHEMVLFDDLMLLDDRGLQNLLQEVDKEVLVLALKGAEWPLVTRILENLSPRAAETLREDISLAGPKRVKDVESARQAVMQIALQLQARGALIFAGKDDENVIY